MERLAHLLSNSDARLITLTGPGGVGKTRLAIEVAHCLNDDAAGEVYWADLAPVRDSGAALIAIAAAIGAKERHRHPLLNAVIDTLRDHRALLVLDNIEQVADLADLIAALIAASPRLSILCTGRSPLDLRAEQRYPVAPLAIPEPTTASDHQQLVSLAAVALFVERAQAVRPDFVLTEQNAAKVAMICRRLDGLPLAIELAATQTELFNPAELLTRLERQLPLVIEGARDLPARHQTMEQTIAWSYHLLSDDLQARFRAISVFVGGFTLPAAAALLTDSTDPRDDVKTMRQVSALLRRSLLHRGIDRAGQERFQMLEMTRVYALERLQEAGEDDAVRRRHARYVRDLAEQGNTQLSSPAGAAWLARLEADHENLRSALDWLLDEGEPGFAAKLAGSLARYWYVRGHLSEGQASLQRVLSHLGEAKSADRVALLRALATIAGAQGNSRSETSLAQEALRHAREIGDEQLIAQSLQSCANAARGEGDFGTARRYSTRALSILERLNDQPGMAVVLNNLGLIVADLGDSDRARTLFERSLAICERLGSERGLAIAGCNIGNQIAETEEPRMAAPYFRTALMLFKNLGDTAGAAWSLQAVATLAGNEREPLRAARLFGAVEAARERIGWSFSAQERAEYDASLNVLRGQLDERELKQAWSQGRTLTLGEAITEALSMLEAFEAEPPDPLTPSLLPAGLSEREGEILRLIAAGLTNAEIAHRLRRSPHTIDAHVRRIYRKLDVQSRSAATRFAVEHDLL